MQTTINNILEELHTSATRMLVLNSDNAMLISYFKNLNDNIVYLKQLVKLETIHIFLHHKPQILR